MKKSFTDSFNEFIDERVGEVLNQADLINNPEYEELRSKQSELYGKLSALSPEAKEIILELDSVSVGLEMVEIRAVYRAALQDGIELKSIVKEDIIKQAS